MLKYRIMEKRQEGIPEMNMDDADKYGIADGFQAFKVVRQHAAEWGISLDRVGFMGFLAGAHSGVDQLRDFLERVIKHVLQENAGSFFWRECQN